MIEVLSPGLQSSVQDLGRFGVAHLGHAQAGAFDRRSFCRAQWLVGNVLADAAIEITLVGPRLLFHRAARVALTGSDFQAHLGRTPLSCDRVFELNAGDELRFEVSRDGARGYLAIGGGIDLTPRFGSRSTDLRAGFGGWEGRALRAGDRLPLGAPRSESNWSSEPVPLEIGARHRLRVTPGLHAEERQFEALLSTRFVVDERSNRQAVRLGGASIPGPIEAGLPSLGTSPGTIQLLAHGVPLILGVDSGATGGYPQLAHLVAEEVSLLGQLRPRDELRFEAAPWS